MNKKTTKKIMLVLIFILSLSLLPFYSQKAFAKTKIVVRYKIVYTLKYKVSQNAKKAPKISKKKASTTVGEVYSICLKNAKGKKIKWSSSNKKIASVKKDGNWCDITAKKPGKVTITAKYKGKKYKCRLKVKKKKAKAFSCTYGGNMVFKKDSPYFNDVGLLSFDNKVSPLTLRCTVKDPSIVKCEWDPDLDLDLWVTPKKEGTTWITISNSYNSQKQRFKVVVGCGYDRYAMYLDQDEVRITKPNSEKVLKLNVPKDVKKIEYTINKKVCTVSKLEWKKGYCLCHIKPLNNGVATITFRDSKHKYVEETAKVTVRAPNSKISTNIDEITISPDEVYNLIVSPDFSSDIITITNNDLLTLRYSGTANGGKSYILKVKGRNCGVATIKISDKVNSSVNKTIKVNVSDAEGTVAQVSCGREHTALLKEDGTLRMTGQNDYGQLGDGTTEDKESFVKIMDGVARVDCGQFHSGIIKQDGSLWMCGDNYYGELGKGKSGPKNPNPVKIMDGVAQVSCGGYHTGILKQDGTLWMCGWNRDGQLGDGTTTDRNLPVKIMDGVAQVSCGSFYTAILKNDGSLWMCGWNRYGELGNGSSSGRIMTPVKIMDGVVQVSCGDTHTGILKMDSSLWMCGCNEDGQLGDRTTTNRATPVKIMSGVKQVDCGGTYMGSLTGIVKKTGELWMCGKNNFGQFGNGKDSYYGISTPVKVMKGIVQVSCAHDHSGILKKGGVLYMNGYSSDGALGDSRYQKPKANQAIAPK